jgi:hypothetical protein
MIECNSIPWASGYTGLVWWSTPGFESAWCRSLIYLEAFFFFLQYSRDIHLFLFFYTACFLLVKNTRQFSYNMKAVNSTDINIPSKVCSRSNLFFSTRRGGGRYPKIL